jgi:WD40 repeat protein/serine/threonine protein kinase
LLDKICEVVHTAHETGIVHRDIKPANVMVISRAGRLLPKLLDFGIAKDLSLQNGSFDKATELSTDKLPDLIDEFDSLKNTLRKNSLQLAESKHPTLFVNTLLAKETDEQNLDLATNKITHLVKTHGIMGSPSYMAPEQWKNAVTADARSDIYALGVTAYELLTGKLPFKGSMNTLMNAHLNKPIPTLATTFAEKFDPIIAKAMAKNAEDRYQTALEFAKDFREAANFTQEQIILPHLDEILKENLLTNAPKPLADMVASLVAARNAYQFRDRLFLVLHVLIRYISILTLASYASTITNEQTSELITKTIANLRHNSLTDLEWLELSRELCRPFAKKRDAFPIPELITVFFAIDSEHLNFLNETFLKLLQMQDEINSNASLKEEQLVTLLTHFLTKLTYLLKATAWLSDYYLVLPEANRATKWMGIAKEISSISLKTSNITNQKAILVDAQGHFVLTLWPLIEIVEPTPGMSLEVFLLERKGRNSAKLVSFPDGFEIETEAPWDWLKQHFITDEEKAKTAKLIEKSPYLGLATFSAKDSNLFFGREKETENFLNRLRIQPLLAVVGPSGAGKSSFIQAGVVAGLDENWQVITVRPGLSPIATLASKLSKVGIELVDLKIKLQKDINFLGNSLRQFASEQNSQILLIIDQFEEILTLCLDKQEQQLYVEAIVLAARSEEDPIRVVLTMRDDFLVKAKKLKALKDRLNQALEILTTPASTELIKILTEPARQAGYEFEDQELPVEIVNEVTEQTSALPLLAFTAAKLWQQRDKEFKQLRRRSYEAMGGVGGALARHAESMLLQMTHIEQSLVREAFRHLVTSEGTRAVLTRPEILQLLGKSGESEAVLEKLISARLLVATEGEKGVDRIEIVHEALLSAWPRLIKWQQEDAEGVRLRDQLRSAARQWQEKNYSRSLLWRDEALTEYQLWRIHYKGKLTELEESFAQSSLSEANRRQFIRRSLIITAMVVLLIVSAVMYYQRQQTQEQLSQTLVLYEEQARKEILKQNYEGAAVYLNEAYLKGANSLALRYMLAVALAKVENHPPITLSNHTDTITTATFNPTDDLVATASKDKTARIWQVADGKELFTLKGHQDVVVSTSFSPDGKLLLTASLDKTAKLWKVADGTLITTLIGHSDALRTAQFSPDGQQILTTSYDHTAKIWDTNTGKLLNTLQGHQATIYAACYSKTGKLIATASADKTVSLWDSNSGELKTTLKGHQAAVINVSFSPDEKLLLTASIDQTARIWQLSDGQQLNILSSHQSAITNSKFSPDGKEVLIMCSDGKSYLWETATGKLHATLEGHQADIVSGDFSKDGKLIVTTSYDKTVRVWERATGKFLVAFAEHEASVLSGIFSNKCDKILSTSEDKTAKIWPLVVETRSPMEINTLVKAKVPIYLKEGRLINPQLPVKKVETPTPQKEENPPENLYIEDLGNSVKIEMVKIKAGEFMMGSPSTSKEHNNNETLHKVTISKSFYMGRYEVTQAQWKVVASLPSINMSLSSDTSQNKGDNLPVENITWDEAMEFCARLSKVTGKHYSLPTESQWEYAARAGNSNEYPENLDEISWYNKNSEGKSHPVGQKKANSWGLYDMYGNVFEWCLDLYGNYPTTPSVDPIGAVSGTNHVLRGSGYNTYVAGSRPADRSNAVPSYHISYLGFRLVLNSE